MFGTVDFIRWATYFTFEVHPGFIVDIDFDPRVTFSHSLEVLSFLSYQRPGSDSVGYFDNGTRDSVGEIRFHCVRPSWLKSSDWNVLRTRIKSQQGR